MLLNILPPFIVGIFYRTGGTDQWKWCPINQKLWRWLGIGLFVGLTYALLRHSVMPLLSIATYAIAIQSAPYGEKSWLNIFGELGKFAICGFVFGLASMPVLGLFWGFVQAIISCVAFIGIKKWDDAGVLKNPLVELLRGFLGTVVYIVG